jgi:hypothetical protein
MAAQVEGLETLLKNLNDRKVKAYRDADADVAVGFTADYALPVHENLEAIHPNGIAKFLEIPARTMRPQMQEIVRKELARGRTLRQALLKAGEFLLRESQKRVPVLTGALRDSGYVSLS